MNCLKQFNRLMWRLDWNLGCFSLLLSSIFCHRIVFFICPPHSNSDSFCCCRGNCHCTSSNTQHGWIVHDDRLQEGKHLPVAPTWLWSISLGSTLCLSQSDQIITSHRCGIFQISVVFSTSRPTADLWVAFCSCGLSEISSHSIFLRRTAEKTK